MLPPSPFFSPCPVSPQTALWRSPKGPGLDLSRAMTEDHRDSHIGLVPALDVYTREFTEKSCTTADSGCRRRSYRTQG